jgi:hypothetical protein
MREMLAAAVAQVRVVVLVLQLQAATAVMDHLQVLVARL